MTRKDVFYIAGLALIIVLFLLQKCSGDKDLENLSEQFSRYKDSAIIYRQVDGKEVSDTKGSEFTMEQFMAADQKKYDAILRIIGRQADLIGVLSARIEHGPVNDQPAVVTEDTALKTVTVSYEDSCMTAKTVLNKGKGLFSYQLKPLSFDFATVKKREKWYKGKEITATGIITSGCGKITSQKSVVIVPGKKKVHQTNAFFAAATIVIFEGVRFLITGKL